MKQKMH